MRRLETWALFLATSLGAGCGAPSQDPVATSGSEEMASPGVSVSAPGLQPLPPAGTAPTLPMAAEATATLEPADAIALNTVHSVRLVLTLRNGVGRLPVVLELESPSGLPYQRLERVVTARYGEALVEEYTVPVAGTLIQQAKLSGDWTARFLVNGQPRAATALALP